MRRCSAYSKEHQEDVGQIEILEIGRRIDLHYIEKYNDFKYKNNLEIMESLLKV
jgi:hypothetical protein